MLDVLEHLVDPAAALRRLRPLMADEGLFALATVNVEGLHGRLRGGDWPWFIRSHLHYFRPATLVRMLADAGFEAVEWSVVPAPSTSRTCCTARPACCPARSSRRRPSASATRTSGRVDRRRHAHDRAAALGRARELDDLDHAELADHR